MARATRGAPRTLSRHQAEALWGESSFRHETGPTQSAGSQGSGQQNPLESGRSTDSAAGSAGNDAGAPVSAGQEPARAPVEQDSCPPDYSKLGRT